ncbi:MAG: thioredoxin domain-containing protein, partial [Bacteroidota bacterium]
MSCKSNNTNTADTNMNTDKKNYPYTNHLIHESSPYLLQHAHNPVDWYPWGEEAFEKAKKEDKLVLISIGYSACHWCHVMEHESFEDTATAHLMNEHFICIKVDREERPDIDQVYMNAVQLMTGQGGWPLNCFALPDGRPVYGGTYFPKQKWNDVLMQLQNIYVKDKAKFIEYAEQLTDSVKRSELVQMIPDDFEFSINDLHLMVDVWKKSFDTKEGGPARVPKFPLPNNYEFLLNYFHLSMLKDKSDENLLKQIHLTLDKMAYGGIYDQIGGGFARYSTDGYWKVPHFEKMLYDNAQLMSLYASAYQQSKDPLYKNVVMETLDWMKREMTSDEGLFYSALDADSEGKEGKFYIWTKKEIEAILKDKASLFCDYYEVDKAGLWEEGCSILLRRNNDKEFAALHHIHDVDAMMTDIVACKKILLQERNKRIHPGLDDKQLTSWNALMIMGYVDAYNAFGEQEHLLAAKRCADFILKNIRNQDGGLYHNYKKGKATINGYLEDYSFMMEALMALYQATFEEHYLMTAKDLADYCIKHFFD